MVKKFDEDLIQTFSNREYLVTHALKNDCCKHHRCNPKSKKTWVSRKTKRFANALTWGNIPWKFKYKVRHQYMAPAY